MSRKHRHRDSLDLLLDTICNTFGGIIFIALIIVLFLNLTQRRADFALPTASSVAEMVNAQARYQATQAQLQAMRLAVEQMEKTRAQFAADPRTRQLLSRLQLVETSHRAESKTRDQELQALADSRRKVNDLLDELVRLEQAVRAAEEEVAVIKTELRREVQLRSQTATLPKQRATQKTQAALLLKGGTLYAFSEPGKDGAMFQNTKETAVQKQGDAESVVPVAGAGQAIDPGQPDDPALRQRFEHFDAAKHYVAVVVWPDSFAHFAAVRQALVRAGLEYQLIPWTGDRPLVLGSPTGPQFVQ